jgi:hypothetical protein
MNIECLKFSKSLWHWEFIGIWWLRVKQKGGLEHCSLETTHPLAMLMLEFFSMV